MKKSEMSPAAGGRGWVRLLVFLFLAIPHISLHAQVQAPVANPDSLKAIAVHDSLIFAGQDTLAKKKRFYSHVVTYTVGEDNATINAIDTTLEGKQYYDPAESHDFEYRNIGNIGTPAMPIVFNPSGNMGFDLGYHQFDIYGFQRNNLLFFDSKVPYVNLLFVAGMYKEQEVNVTYNQNFGKYFNVGIAFNRYASGGEYADQSVNHNCIAATMRYRSKNDQYHLTGIFIFNSYQDQENGGIQGGNIFDGQAVNPTFVTTNLTAAQARQTQMSINLRQEWRTGQTVVRKINDSTSTSTMYPTLTFYHELETYSEKYNYFDVAPINTAYYGALATTDDSLLSHVRYSHWANTVGFTLGSIKAVDTTAIYRNYLINGSMYFAVGNIFQDPVLNQMQELRFNLQLRSHPQAQSGLIYNSDLSYNVTGYNNQDLKLDGSVGYNLKKIGSLVAFGSFSRKEAPWLFNHFYYPALDIDNDFRKTITFTAGIWFQIPQFHFKVSGQFYNVTYPVYWNTDYTPAQLGSSVQAWIVKVEKNFRWRHLGSDNLFVLQFFTGQDILRFPKYWSHNSIFYENSLFKKNLQLRIGGEIYYNTNYYADGYFGYTGQFYLQNDLNLKYYPVLGVFISLKIAEAIVFIKAENLTEGLFYQKNYFAAYQYPVPDRAFQVGVSWRFYE